MGEGQHRLPGSVIPAQAGIQRSRSASTAPRSVIPAQAESAQPLSRHRLRIRHSGAGPNQCSRSAGTASGSVIPAQAGIQRNRSAGTAFRIPSFRRRPESNAAAQ